MRKRKFRKLFPYRPEFGTWNYLKSLESEISWVVHRWKCCWLKLQDDKLAFFDRQWTILVYGLLGARIKLARVRINRHDE